MTAPRIRRKCSFEECPNDGRALRERYPPRNSEDEKMLAELGPLADVPWCDGCCRDVNAILDLLSEGPKSEREIDEVLERDRAVRRAANPTR